MTRNAVSMVLAIALTGLWARALAQGPGSQPAAVEPKAVAVLVAGLGGSKAYSRNILDWTNRFYKVLTTQCGLKAEHIVVLTEKADPRATPPRLQSTRENFRAAMKKVAALLTPVDQFILFMVGHGQINEPVGKLCLPGRDLDSDELDRLLGALPTTRIVIINAASGGAEFLKSYIDPGRVIITAAGAGNDGNQTYFAEFFIRGYETHRADANKDKVIDLFEAYAYAARETANFYHRQYLVNPGGRVRVGEPLVWYVRGKETRAIWRKLYAGTNNRLGLPRRNPGDPPLPDPDAEPDTEPKFGRFDVHWHNRRVLAEHARLDDNDTKKGFFLWQPYKFQKPPEDRPENVGYLARRTVLGRPEPLERPRK